jgi:hypothetical protein
MWISTTCNGKPFMFNTKHMIMMLPLDEGTTIELSSGSVFTIDMPVGHLINIMWENHLVPDNAPYLRGS